MNDMQDAAPEGEDPAMTREYTIGIDNDAGDCPDIVVKRNGKPIATLTAGEIEAAPLVHAGNCHRTLIKALKAAEAAIEEASDIMLYEDGQPVTFLESNEIDRAFNALVSVMVQIHEAIRNGDPE